ncbi:MAG: aminotransferase class III-fold pyridoxal phosphate-dependent enzyme [Myxococcota bacterium]
MSGTTDLPFFFTWTAQREARPFALAGGEGAWCRTEDGERWLDLASLIYQANAGHGHGRILDAVRAQVDRLCLAMPNAVYPEKTALAERLLAHAPAGFDKVLFTLGGAEANENAIKMARMFTGRVKLVSRERSYHGATYGALSLSGDRRRAPAGPGLADVVRVPDWDCPRCPAGLRGRGCDHPPLSHIPAVLEGGDVAAVVVESVVGGNGVRIPPPGYMRAIREACDRHGALLVCDEVLTGFGRTGRWFAVEHGDGVVPDMITCGKALTAGYGVLGAVLVHERVARHFDHHVLWCGLTGYAHPLGVAAALEALRVYEDESLVRRAAELEPRLRRGLEAAAARCGAAGESRVIGLLSATDLSLDAAGWARLREALRRRRVLAHPLPHIGALILAPPLCIGEEDLDRGLRWVGDALEESCP